MLCFIQALCCLSSPHPSLWISGWLAPDSGSGVTRHFAVVVFFSLKGRDFPELHEKKHVISFKRGRKQQPRFKVASFPGLPLYAPRKKNKGEEGLVHVTDINFDLYPRSLNMQTCLPAITTTLKLPASTAGKGCSEDTFAGAGLCQKLHHPASHPIFCMLLVLIVMYPLC